MSEEPRPRRSVGAQPELPEFRDEDPLAPRRAAGAGQPASPGDDDSRRQWIVVGAIGLAMVVMVAVLYVVFGTDAGDHEAAPPTTATPSASASPSPEAPPSPAGTVELVDDTAVTVPDHWELYADEVTEGDRRLIRVRDVAHDVSLQVATLTSVGTELPAACQALITDQGSAYVVDFQVTPQFITIDGDAVAVTCGFVGTREDDGAATSVLFTMVQRGSDLHTLVVRMMRPQDLSADTPALREAATMTCEATRNFGSALPLC